MLRYKELTERLRCILALRISSQKEGGSVRTTLRPFPRKLNVRHVLLRLKTSKKLRLTGQKKHVRR